jgi:hypothetical protein
MERQSKLTRLTRICTSAFAVAVATLTLTAPGANAGLLVSSASDRPA